MLFSSAVQPSIVSLFSSTGSDPLFLFKSSCDQSLPSDSFVHLLHDRQSEPLPADPRSLLRPPEINEKGEGGSESCGHELDQTVLHIQSPTIRTTYIQCPPNAGTIALRDMPNAVLGIKHPWMHLQVRNLGRQFSFEVGIVDLAGRSGTVRMSTFQNRPRLKVNHEKPGSLPLLLLPLSFPSRSTHLLTPWSTISIHLPTLLPYFSSPLLRSKADHDDQDEDESENKEPAASPSTSFAAMRRQWGSSHPPHPTGAIPAAIPTGKYSHVSYVRVYANCRLRRIWFADSPASQKVPWEFELYSSD